MMGLYRLRQNLVTMLIVFVVFQLSGVAQAQFGPPSPQPKPTPQLQEGAKKITDSFMRFFKGGATDTETVENGATAGQEGEKIQKDQPTSFEVAVPQVETPAPATPAQPKLLEQPKLLNPKVVKPKKSEDNPPEIQAKTLDNPNNPLGLSAATQKLKSMETLVKNKQYAQARASLGPFQKWLISATESHINLYKTLNAIPSARGQAELEKHLALQFAILRDRSFYVLSKILIAEKDYQTAVKHLSEVVKSQPRSSLGMDAYALLQEIGFTQKLQLAE